MIVERVLDFDAVNVFAAADQHILRTIDDRDEAVFVDGDEITGVHVAVGDRFCRGVGAVQVFRDYVRAFHPQLAD